MGLPRLAAGIKYMLDHAIHQHRRAHQGRYPKRFELHPQLEPELYLALGPQYYLRAEQRLSYQDVEIVLTPRAREPRLITCRNEIELL